MNPSNYHKDPRVHIKIDKHIACPDCFRSKENCFCHKVKSHDNRLSVIILQHPQEQYKLLNSARLANLALTNSRLFVGLSWPNFKIVAGPDQIPSQWGILYLKSENSGSKPFQIFDRSKRPLENSNSLKGIIALDGSWKQAKTLWWRNPWFLKLNRITLNPQHSSLRGQSKKEGLATIEAIALALECMGEESGLTKSLHEQYESLIIKGTTRRGPE